MLHVVRIAFIAAIVVMGPVYDVYAQAQVSQLVEVDVAAQPLESALRRLADQHKLQIVFVPQDVRGLNTQGVKGRLTIREAVQKLIEGTGLVANFNGADTVVIRTAERPRSQLAPADDVVRAEGIVVTAQKRGSELLLDVPVPVTALNSENLATRNQLRLEDYYNKVPGLSLSLVGDASSPVIGIRGITTGGITNPSVGILIDDVPYGSSTVQGGFSPPDIDPGELARVEVLRGPQATLYGANAIGGLVNFVTINPSVAAISGQVQAGYLKVSEGESGHLFRASVNLPISESLAVRVNGFTVRDPGYVNNVQTGAADINTRQSDGGRVVALWQPSGLFSLKLSAMTQDSLRLGTADVDTRRGGALEQTALPDTGLYGRKTEAYSAIMNAALGVLELTSLTGYSKDRLSTAIDASPIFGTQANNIFQVSGVAGPANRNTEKFSQEVRASIPLSSRINWLVGAFYTNEEVDIHLVYRAVNPSTFATVGTLLTIDQPSTFKEYAAFTNVTFDVTPRFDVQVGGRISENKQTFSAVRGAPLAAILFGANTVVREVSTKDSGTFTYLLTPRFKVTPDFMLYGRIASGYRPGGPNATCGSPNIPCQYDADTTQNYEVGVKGTLLNRAVSFDASIYYIDWKDIQVNLFQGGFVFVGNALRAKSQGVELSVEGKPARGLTVSGWAAYNDAELTKDFPTTALAASGRAGDRLPYSSRYSANLSVDQEFPISNDLKASIGASVSYVDDRKGIFRPATVVRETFPGYSQADIRGSILWGSWRADAFINNVGDKRGILRSGLDSNRPTFVTYIQPRTFGISVTRKF
jgi:iron complex outermembrane recepter protein